MEHKNKIDEIRRAALRLLEKEGPEAVSMRRVAGAAKITPMAIYHYFRTREALLQDITAAEFEKQVARLEALPVPADPEHRLRQILESHLEYAIKRPRVYDYVFSNPRPGARRFPKDFQERKSPTFNLLMDAVAAAIEHGYFRQGDVFEISLTIAAHTQGLITLYRGGRFKVSNQQFKLLCWQSFAKVFHGLRKQK